MRLIDADELAVTYCEIDNQYHSEPWILDDILAFLNDAPTIEATPVVHGRWIDMGDFQSCSICKATRLKEIGTPYGKATWVKTIFCPDCSAKMDGGVSDG